MFSKYFFYNYNSLPAQNVHVLHGNIYISAGSQDFEIPLFTYYQGGFSVVEISRNSVNFD